MPQSVSFRNVVGPYLSKGRNFSTFYTTPSMLSTVAPENAKPFGAQIHRDFQGMLSTVPPGYWNVSSVFLDRSDSGADVELFVPYAASAIIVEKADAICDLIAARGFGSLNPLEREQKRAPRFPRMMPSPSPDASMAMHSQQVRKQDRRGAKQ